MDFRVQNTQAYNISAERLYQQQGPQQQAPGQLDDANFLQMLQDVEKTQENKASDTVLSYPEMATLHALFGSEKPAGEDFYGKNGSNQIHKGHLIDVAG